MKIFNPLWIIENFFTLNWVGAAISVGGSLLGGALGSDAAKGATGDANAGIQQGINEIKAIGDRTRTDTEPYRTLGSESASRLAYLLGLAPTYDDPAQLKEANNQLMADFTDHGAAGGRDFLYQDAKTSGKLPAYYQLLKSGALDASTGTSKHSKLELIASTPNPTTPKLLTPLDRSDGQYGSLLKQFSQDDLNNDLVYQNGLQFGLDEGEKAINNRARAVGGYDSGSVLKALTRYGNDYATTKTGDAYNRFTGRQGQLYNMLTGSTNIGQNAVNTDANTGSQMAQAIGGAYGSMGANNAAGRMGSANAWGKAIGGVASALGGLF